jgi:hypothetical protein
MLWRTEVLLILCVHHGHKIIASFPIGERDRRICQSMLYVSPKACLKHSVLFILYLDFCSYLFWQTLVTCLPLSTLQGRLEERISFPASISRKASEKEVIQAYDTVLLRKPSGIPP